MWSRHAKGAMFGWAFLQFAVIRSFGLWLLVPFVAWYGYTNHWFDWLGQSPQANAPVEDATDYILRGRERIKSPFMWEDGIEDIQTAIQINSAADTFYHKFSLTSNYFDLARAYGIRGNKSASIQSLNKALAVAYEAKTLADSDIQRNGASAKIQITSGILQKCLASDCKGFWSR